VRGTRTGKASGCTLSPVKAEPGRRQWPGRSPSRSPRAAARSCSSRWRAARESPASSMARRCPTRSGGGRGGPPPPPLSGPPPLPSGGGGGAGPPATDTLPGGDVYALAADAETALIEYLEMFYNLRHAGTALTRLGVVDFATTIAPGLRDVLLTGKAAEATRRRFKGRPVYDAVVMDAPPTGRIGKFLNVATEVSGLARVGPIHGHAETVESVIRSPQTAVHFVTVLEEMPVQETLDGIAELRGLAQGGLQLGGIMINMVRPVELTDDQLDAAAHGALDEHELDLGLKAAGLEDSLGLAAG